MRRIALVVTLGLLAAGCGSKATEPAEKSPPCATNPPYNETVTNCRSPDGAWSVTLTDYYDGPLLVSRAGGAKVPAYGDEFTDCCDYITWAKPHTLLFVDNDQLMRLNPVTRKHRQIASWSDFVVSPDGRWIAGWAAGASVSPVGGLGVVSVDGKTCLALPQGSDETDWAAGFTRDSKNVIVNRPLSWPLRVQYAISSLPTSDHWC